MTALESGDTSGVESAIHRFKSIKSRFEQAEEEYHTGRIWTKNRAGKQASVAQDDLQEALQRTRIRVLRSAVTARSPYDELQERGRRNAISARDTIYVTGYNAEQVDRNRQRRAKRKEEGEEATDGYEDGDENGEVARLVAEQVADIKNRMPSSSLMECIHSDASHFYDARQLMTEEQLDPATAKDKARWGMTGACEGSALVALAVFVEEMAKWEGSAAGGEDIETGPSSSTKQSMAWDRLEELRQKQTEKLKRHARGLRRQRKMKNPSPTVASSRRPKRSTRIHETSVWAFGLDKP